MAGVSAAFLFMAESHSVAGMDHRLPIRLSDGGHLDCFCFLAVMNKAPVNICMQVFGRGFPFLLGVVPRSGTALVCGSCMFNLLRNCFPKWPHRFTFPVAV